MVLYDFYGKIMTCGTVIEHKLTDIQSVCIKQQHEANMGKIIFYHLKSLLTLGPLRSFEP